MLEIKLNNINNFPYENDKISLDFICYTSPQTNLHGMINDVQFKGTTNEKGEYEGTISLLKTALSKNIEMIMHLDDSLNNSIETIRINIISLIEKYLAEDLNDKPNLCHSPVVRKFLLDLKTSKEKQAKEMLSFIRTKWKQDLQFRKFITEYFVKQTPSWFYGNIIPEYSNDYVIIYSSGKIIVSNKDNSFIFFDNNNIPVPPILLDLDKLGEKKQIIMKDSISKVDQVFLIKNPNGENILHSHPIEKIREHKNALFNNDHSLVMILDENQQKNIYINIRYLDIKKYASSILKIL